MHNYVLENFDWACYRNFAQSRFLDGREGAILSHGFHNLVTFSIVVGLVCWAFSLWSEFSAIRQTLVYMRNIRKVLYLEGLAEYANDLVSLTKEHFNLVVKSRTDSMPLPIARIRVPADLTVSTLSIYHSEDELASDWKEGPVDDLASVASHDNLGVSFTIDCNRTTFLSAHWGVPVSTLRDICVDKKAEEAEAQTQLLQLNNLLKSLLSNILSRNSESLLNDHPIELLNNIDGKNLSLGRFNLLAHSKKICSNEPVCYDAGTGIQCMVSPPVKTVQVAGQELSIWDVLLRRYHDGESIIPLVIVLYSPRVQDTGAFSEGSVESYQAIAEVTLVSFKGAIRHLPNIKNDYDISSVNIKVDMHKQICFSNDFRMPQEPREMFGMGDTETDCLICIANKMDTLLLPCGHASFCYSCLRSLRNEKCPVCRGVFTSYIRFPLATPIQQQ